MSNGSSVKFTYAISFKMSCCAGGRGKQFSLSFCNANMYLVLVSFSWVEARKKKLPHTKIGKELGNKLIGCKKVCCFAMSLCLLS